MDRTQPHLPATSDASDAPTRPARRPPVSSASHGAWRRRLPSVPAPWARWRTPLVTARLGGLRAVASHAAEVLTGTLGVSVAVEAVTTGRADAVPAGAVFAFVPAATLGPALLALDPEIAAGLVSAITGTDAAAISGRPDRITAAVLGHGLLSVLRALGDAGLGAPRLAAGPPARPELWIDLRLRIGTRTGTVSLGLDAEAAGRLLASLASPSPLLSPALARAPLPVELCLGPARLAAATVRALAPGDALLPDPDVSLDAEGPAGGAFLRTGAGCGVLGRIEARQLTVARLGRPSPTVIEEATVHPDDTDALEVDVRVVLATLPATLAELGAIEPGAIVPLPAPDPRVRLVVGDRTIATGELVDADGVLAVRVLAAHGGRP